MDDPKVSKLNTRAEDYLSKNNHLEALDCYTQIYDILNAQESARKKDVYMITEKIVKLLNVIAMKFIKQDKHEEAWSVLKKAESFAEAFPYLKVPTFNNMACLYRKLSRFKSALIFLEQALVIEYKHLTSFKTDSDFEHSLLQENPADTHLNLCKILCAIGKHDIACLHALKALTFFQTEIFGRAIISGEGIRPSYSGCNILFIAYNNLGTELEFLKRKEDSLKV